MIVEQMMVGQMMVGQMMVEQMMVRQMIVRHENIGEKGTYKKPGSSTTNEKRLELKVNTISHSNYEINYM